MAVLSVDNGEIVRAVLQVAGFGRDAANMDAATEADVRTIIRSGLRRFFFPTQNGFPYTWRFLEKSFTISANPVFETDTTLDPDSPTIEVSSGTVTLTGSTWPADIIDHFIRVSGHTLFVESRDTDTTLTVSHKQLTVAAGTAFEAPRFRYPLPTDFGTFQGGVVYANDADNWALVASSEPELRLRYAINFGLSDKTSHYAVQNEKILFWPVPEPDAFIQGLYIAEPDDNLPADLTSPGSVVQVDPMYSEAVVEAILAAAESFNDDTAGIHEQRFQAALVAAIAHDQLTGGHFDFSHPAGEETTRSEIVRPILFEPA